MIINGLACVNYFSLEYVSTRICIKPCGCNFEFFSILVQCVLKWATRRSTLYRVVHSMGVSVPTRKPHTFILVILTDNKQAKYENRRQNF